MLFIPLFAFSQAYQKKIRVLFLGNSYTYVNNLPNLIAGIALQGGDSLIFDSNCPGGYTFNNHFTDLTSLNKIKAGTWNYVVLQAQSQEPSFSPGQVGAQTFPYALKLDSVIKKYNPCATTVFYETWGRKNGDALNCGSYPPVCTYLGMQTRLRQSYKSFADSTKGIMVPAGECFRSSISYSPALELYQADESHPTLEGSYLTACAFYETLFQRSVLSNTYNPGIATPTLSYLQQVAHNVVRDSVGIWNLGIYLPWADFTVVALNSSSFQFSISTAPMSAKWFFGDGASSQLLNPSHTYLNSGTYTVSHVVYNACKRDSVSKNIVALSTVGLQKTSSPSGIGFYPNPTTDVLHIIVPKVSGTNYTISITDLGGSMLFFGTNIERIELKDVEKGCYFIQIQTETDELRSILIKN